MLEMSVDTPRSHECPTILLQQANQILYFRRYAGRLPETPNVQVQRHLTRPASRERGWADGSSVRWNEVLGNVLHLVRIVATRSRRW